MARRLQKNMTLQDFKKECNDKGLTYAQAQIQETKMMIPSLNKIPANYKKAGEKGNNV